MKRLNKNRFKKVKTSRYQIKPSGLRGKYHVIDALLTNAGGQPYKLHKFVTKNEAQKQLDILNQL